MKNIHTFFLLSTKNPVASVSSTTKANVSAPELFEEWPTVTEVPLSETILFYSQTEISSFLI